MLKRGLITYTQNQRKAKSKLDCEIEEPRQLVCSPQFTVVLTPTQVVVALGGSRILDGVEFLGPMGDGFTWANCYTVDIRETATESILSASIRDNQLRLKTMVRRTWRLDMVNPSEWVIDDHGW